MSWPNLSVFTEAVADVKISLAIIPAFSPQYHLVDDEVSKTINEMISKVQLPHQTRLFALPAKVRFDCWRIESRDRYGTTSEWESLWDGRQTGYDVRAKAVAKVRHLRRTYGRRGLKEWRIVGFVKARVDGFHYEGDGDITKL